MRAFIAAIVIGLSPLCAIAAATADGNTDPLAPAEILDRIRLGHARCLARHHDERRPSDCA